MVAGPNDIGIDINKKVISGNKWFSNKEDNVVPYATNFHTRIYSDGTPFILKVSSVKNL